MLTHNPYKLTGAVHHKDQSEKEYSKENIS